MLAKFLGKLIPGRVRGEVVRKVVRKSSSGKVSGEGDIGKGFGSNYTREITMEFGFLKTERKLRSLGEVFSEEVPE